MAYKSAAELGIAQPVSMYGDVLLYSDGNGDTYGEQTIEVVGDPRLTEIMVMRSEMAQNPMPGDDRLAELLTFEEIILSEGLAKDYHSILEDYPDLSEFMRNVTVELPEVAEAIEEAAEPDVMTLVVAPVEYWEQLSEREAHDVLTVMLESVARLQVEAIEAAREEFDLATQSSLFATDLPQVA